MSDTTTLLLRGGYVVTGDMDDSRHAAADVLIKDGLIADVGPEIALDPESFDGEVIDARNAIVMPGFINAHMHSNETFEQGAYEKLPLELWPVHCYPPFHQSEMTTRARYLRTALCAIQSIRSGVTTIQDDYLDPAPDAFDAAARAYHDMGLRSVMTVSFLDIPFADGRPFLGELLPPELLRELHASPPPTIEEQVDTFEQHRSAWHHPDQRSSVILAPIAPQRCSESLLAEIARISEEQNVAVHCHVDETRLQAVTARRFFDCSLTEYLQRAGLLTERLTLNHAILVE